MTDPETCPVCRAGGVAHFRTVGGQAYYRCPRCEATFLHPDQRPDRADERAHYALHDNRVDDPRYRAFLARLAEPLLARLAPGSRGLDYGCGPGPALAAMLREAGHTCDLFDPAYYPDPPRPPYAFLTCTEVAEHFHDPAGEFDRLLGLLAPGGLLAVMTCFQTDDARFAAWHYRADPTHVVFYRAATLRRIAADRGAVCEIPRKDVALIVRPA